MMCKVFIAIAIIVLVTVILDAITEWLGLNPPDEDEDDDDNGPTGRIGWA